MERIQDRCVWKWFTFLDHWKDLLGQEGSMYTYFNFLSLGILGKKRHCPLCLSRKGYNLQRKVLMPP